MIGCNSQIAYKIHLGTLQEIVQHSESSYFLEWFWIAPLSFTRRIIALYVSRVRRQLIGVNRSTV